jgi:hypothetical protein
VGGAGQDKGRDSGVETSAEVFLRAVGKDSGAALARALVDS